MIQHALIMAAGRGNRMRPLTDILPKSMVPYKNDTLIGHSLEKLRHQVPNIHVTVGYKKAMLAHYLMEKGINSLHNTEGHGNAWWIGNTLLRYVNEPVLVLTTDNVTEIDLQFLAEEYQRCGEPVCMLVPTTPLANVSGDYLLAENDIVLEISRQSISDRYCTGIQVINPFIVNKSMGNGQTDDFNTIWRELMKEKQLKVSNLYPHVWFSIDTLENLSSNAD